MELARRDRAHTEAALGMSGCFLSQTGPYLAHFGPSGRVACLQIRPTAVMLPVQPALQQEALCLACFLPGAAWRSFSRWP